MRIIAIISWLTGSPLSAERGEALEPGVLNRLGRGKVMGLNSKLERSLLIRRSLKSANEIAYYFAHAREGAPLAETCSEDIACELDQDC